MGALRGAPHNFPSTLGSTPHATPGALPRALPEVSPFSTPVTGGQDCKGWSANFLPWGSSPPKNPQDPWQKKGYNTQKDKEFLRRREKEIQTCTGKKIREGDRRPPTVGCSFSAYSWKLPACSGAFLLTVASGSCFACSFSFFTCSFRFWAYNFSLFACFFTYRKKVRLMSTYTDCKQRSSTEIKRTSPDHQPYTAPTRG